MPKVEVEKGIELFYEDLGEGDKYILSLMMDFPPEDTTRELAKHGYHVLLITNRGIGKSTHVFENYGAEWFNIFADDVVRLADKLGIELNLFDMQASFREEVIDKFVASYERRLYSVCNQTE